MVPKQFCLKQECCHPKDKYMDVLNVLFCHAHYQETIQALNIDKPGSPIC